MRGRSRLLALQFSEALLGTPENGSALDSILNSLLVETSLHGQTAVHF